MSEITPGPWIVIDSTSVIHGDDNGKCIAQCQDYLPQVNEANARAIAAVPDMLTALEWIADSDFVRDAIGTGNLQGVYAAIAKVKGPPVTPPKTCDMLGCHSPALEHSVQIAPGTSVYVCEPCTKEMGKP